MKFKRIGILACVAAAVIAVPFAQMAVASHEKGHTKTTICHVTADDGTGVVIEVAQAAVKTHIKMHGDSTKYKIKKGSNECVVFTKCQPKICHKGYVWDCKLNKCVPDKGGCDPQKCPPGSTYDCKLQKCVPDGHGCKPRPCPKGESWSCKAEKCLPN